MKVAIPTNDGIRIISNMNDIKGFKIYEINDGVIQQERFIKNFTDTSHDRDYDYRFHNN